MLINLLLILIVTAMSLTVILWAGTLFFQGYIYTEPSPGIFWQAPAAACVLTSWYGLWCLLIALSSTATPQNLPIDSIFRFTAKEDMPELQDKPAERLWAIKSDRKKTGDDKDGEVVAYVRKPGVKPRYQYKDTIAAKPWQPQDVIAIEIELPDKSKKRFDLVPTEPSDYRQFVSADGWVIREYEEGPTGAPIKFRFSRLVLNVLFNVAHFVAWFLGLWVLLRFQWTHALGLAAVLWLTATILLLPMMLGYAGLVAANRHVPMAFLMIPLQAQG